MSSAVTECKETSLPIVSITIGALLLLLSLFFLIAYHFLSLTPGVYSATPTITTLLLLMMCGIYLLACLVANKHWRMWQQRSSAALVVIGSILFLYWETVDYSPGGLTLSPPNTLLSLTLLGIAALIQSWVRNLTHLALVFLLILSATTLAIFGVIAVLLDYDPIFPWYGVHHMSLLSAAGLLMFSFGLAYMSWWCHRNREYDTVSGITLLVSTLLLFTMLLGSGLIYIVSATHLHFDARNDMSNLLRERTARIESVLHEARIHASILANDALQQKGGLWTQQLANDISLRITDRNGRYIRSLNAEWFERKSTATIEGVHSQLWRGEEGPCQLRVRELRDGYKIEIGIALDLLPILDGPLGNDGSESLKLCTQQPDGELRCLTPEQPHLIQLKPLQQGINLDSITTAGAQFYLSDNIIQAVMPLPEYNLLVLLEHDEQTIAGPLLKKLSLTIPLALLLLGASISLITWRIHPLARKLQHNEHLYRSLVDGAGDAILMHASDRRFIEANTAACGLLGYSHDELIGMHPNDFLLPEDQQNARDVLEVSRRESKPITSRRLLRHKDGALIPVEIRATHLNSGEMISVVRDISVQVGYENELREKERFIRSVVEVLAEGVVVHDTEGTVIYSNQAALRILGNDRTMAGKNAGPLEPHSAVIQVDGSPLPPGEHPAMISLRQGLSKREVIIGILRSDGECIWISVNSDPLWNLEHNIIIGAVASFSDVSQKRNLEQELYQSRERLRALSAHLLQVREEEKNIIAQDIHDELGSNLTAIKMGIEWLSQVSAQSTPELRERLTNLKEVTTHAILATRRLVTQLRPTILEDLGLWAALEWQLRELSKHSAIEVSATIRTQHLSLYPSTALSIYRVVQEVLHNITKHARASKVHFDCWNTEDELHLTIEDDGIGITEDSAYRIDSYGIRGMYERIGQLKGTLQILGTPNEGTLVSITIPTSQQTEENKHD